MEIKPKKFVNPENMFANWDFLSFGDRNKLEEIQYRKQLIFRHSFTPSEYEKLSRMRKDELYRKIEEVDNK